MDIKQIKKAYQIDKPVIAYKLVKKYGDKIWGPSQQVCNTDDHSIINIYSYNSNFIVEDNGWKKIHIENINTDDDGNVIGVSLGGGLYYFYKDSLPYSAITSNKNLVCLKCQLLDTIYFGKDDDNRIGSSAFKIIEEYSFEHIEKFNIGDNVILNPAYVSEKECSKYINKKLTISKIIKSIEKNSPNYYELDQIDGIFSDKCLLNLISKPGTVISNVCDPNDPNLPPDDNSHLVNQTSDSNFIDRYRPMCT